MSIGYKDTARINKSGAFIRYMSCEHSPDERITVITLNRTYDKCSICQDETEIG